MNLRESFLPTEGPSVACAAIAAACLPAAMKALLMGLTFVLLEDSPAWSWGLQFVVVGIFGGVGGLALYGLVRKRPARSVLTAGMMIMTLAAVVSAGYRFTPDFSSVLMGLYTVTELATAVAIGVVASFIVMSLQSRAEEKASILSAMVSLWLGLRGLGIVSEFVIQYLSAEEAPASREMVLPAIQAVCGVVGYGVMAAAAYLSRGLERNYQPMLMTGVAFAAGFVAMSFVRNLPGPPYTFHLWSDLKWAIVELLSGAAILWAAYLFARPWGSKRGEAQVATSGQ